MPSDEKIVAIHVDPVSWFQSDYQPLHKVSEQIRAINNKSDVISDLEWPILNYLGKVVERSLACDTDHTDDGVPIPCKTDRDEAMKAMTMYLEIHGRHVIDY